MAAIFEDYFSTNKASTITYRGKIYYQGMEKAGDFFLRGAIYMLVPVILYYWPFSFPYASVVRIILMAAAFIISWKLLHIVVAQRLQSVPILQIDTKSKTVLIPQDKFETEFMKIKQTEIIEEASEQGEKQYRFKFHLEDGDITSFFTFNTYGKIDSLLKEIKSKLQQTS